MEFKNRVASNFWGLVLILCISKVCHGQLMCYVCDNCAQITAETPQLACNEDFFNAGGVTDSSTQTTTEMAKTTAGVTEDNNDTTTTSTIMTEETTLTPSDNNTAKTTMTTTTESKSPESTTKLTTENVKETSTETTAKQAESTATTTTTEEQPPSPHAVGLSQTSTTIKSIDDVETLNNQSVAHRQHVNRDEVEDVDIEEGTTKSYTPSAEFRVRQLRSVSDVTFNCFKVEATVNGSMVVNRGCARVQTNESVCGQWESQHPSEKMNKCYPCSRTKCNGSSALNVSITALFVALVAAFLHRK